MVTLLECIERIPSLLRAGLETRAETQRELFTYLGDRVNKLEQIVLVGSGTSNTSCITAAIFMEQASGLETHAVVPSDFCYQKRCYNPNALYVFVSQTGTSGLTREAQRIVREKDLLHVCVSEQSTTPLAKEAACFLGMGCGHEEYPMRTIGYSTTVFTLMLMGLEIGMRRGAVTAGEYEAYLAQAAAVPESLSSIPTKTLEWMQKHSEWSMMHSDCLIFTGAGALYGVALEGAVKAWETPKIISAGYELEEGLHGPNFGYNGRHCVVILNDGGRDSGKAKSLTGYMKEVWNNGFMAGANPVYESDLDLDLVGGPFACLELASVPQTITYKLALDMGRDLFAPHDNSAMSRYFSTHTKEEAVQV